MSDKLAAERACKEPNPIIDGRKANVNLAYLGAKPRQNGLASELFLLLILIIFIPLLSLLIFPILITTINLFLRFIFFFFILFSSIPSKLDDIAEIEEASM